MTRDARVTAYVAKSAPFARPILRRLRSSFHAACPKGEETIKWGMPFFLSNGKIVCFMAAFKAHAAFGFWKGAARAALGDAGKPGEAMGHLGRLTSIEDVPSEAKLRGWIRKAASDGPGPASKRRGR
jgi:hypothetical protein